MLEKIVSPQSLSALSYGELEALAAEIRQTLVDAAARQGGHLASNLGAVELTLALHRVFRSPQDKIIFDVGHQSYTHKLLTGRQALAQTLRAEGGVSGFPKRSESEHDVFETGHASTAISAALGFARARDLQYDNYAVVALVGDGAMTGGLCYEALNDAGSRPTQLLVVLNDNEMSISRNVGALSTYLTHLRGSRRWIGAKQAVKRGLNRVPLVGAPLAGLMERVKRSIKRMLVPGEFFEALGFAYLGPIDGHDIPTLEHVLADAYAMHRPVVVHAITQKGRGYALAEHKPEAFHGVAPFFVENGRARTRQDDGLVSACDVAGEALLALAREDERVVAITAAMPQGTGLDAFSRAFPERFFDVGIAEEHAVTMAAGLAAAGMRPYFGVYATFLQRSMDQLLHDVCLQNLPVTVLVDHAGFVAGDGATHQGVYDLTMLRAMPHLTVWSPCDAPELCAMLAESPQLRGPCVIRYPRSLPLRAGGDIAVGRWRLIADGDGPALLGYGASVGLAQAAAGLLQRDGLRPAVWSLSSLQADEEAMSLLAKRPLVAVVEEQRVAGGMGEMIAAGLPGVRVLRLGVGDQVPCAHSLDGLRGACGLDAAQIAARVKEAWHAR